jgi:hypothetical protein
VKGIRKTNHNNAIQAHDTVQHFLFNNSLNSSLAPSPAIKRPPAGTYSIWDWAPQLATAAGSALVFASIWQTLMRLFPKTMIYICLVTGSVATGTTIVLKRLLFSVSFSRTTVSFAFWPNGCYRNQPKFIFLHSRVSMMCPEFPIRSCISALVKMGLWMISEIQLLKLSGYKKFFITF